MKRRSFIAALAALSALPGRAYATPYERVRSIVRTVPGVVGVYCRTLGNGPPVFEYNPDESFPTASIIKVLIMTTAFVTEERNPGALDEVIVFDRRDLIGGSDFMATQPDGARLSVRRLLVPMIQLSDNTASNLLITHFGFDAINSVGAAAGMQHTVLARHFLDFAAIVHHNDNVTTPADMAQLLYTISHGAREDVATIVSPEHCKRMIEIMLGQTDRDAIPAGLPPRTQVANKTGEIDGTRNDVAIVEPFGDSPYILVVCSKWVTNYDAIYSAIHRVARFSYGLVGRSGV